MQYELHEDGSLTALPQKNIDTGLGLDRMAAILQDVPSVYETEHFRPLVELGEELSGRAWGRTPRPRARCASSPTTAAALTFLLADGVVPSNEDRGYVLRRIMRRAIQQGRVLGHRGLVPARAVRARDRDDGRRLPRAAARAPTIERWARAEEESFGRTLEQGERLLAELIERAKEEQTSWVSAEDAFQLHDTYGFPYELTKELLAEEGLSVDDQGFEELMEQAREVSRAAARDATAGDGGECT